MIKYRKKAITGIIIPFLLLFLIQGDMNIYSEVDGKALFETILTAYQQRDYPTAIKKIESLLTEIKSADPKFTAEVKLLAAACYGQDGNKDQAIYYFEEINAMIAGGKIASFPKVAEIDTTELSGYDEVFTTANPLFSYREPIPVDNFLKRNVIYAPRKSIQAKRKKRFPWLPVIAGVALVVGAAVILLLEKKENRIEEFAEIDWVKIPAGAFTMGDNFHMGDPDEQPVHQVNLEEFYISRYEITVEQYDFFCVETNRKRLSPDLLNAYKAMKNVPISGVDWQDAQSFCQWLSSKNGQNIQLPTEAQWEKAARGTTDSLYPWGNEAPDCDRANFVGCGAFENLASRILSTGSHPAGASPYGIQDMAGNVAEWCRDWYSSTYYTVSPGSNPQGPGSGSQKVVRGGGIESFAGDLRTSNRSFKDQDFSGISIGFRIIMK